MHLRLSISTACRKAFTLVEILISIVVLALLMIMITRLFTASQAVIGMANKHMDAETQARAVFDRMAIDFAQMVKRPDVDYCLKSGTADQYGNSQPQPGNDQIAFYSQGPGYFPAATGSAEQSPVSLVAYRINTDNAGSNPYLNKLQRLGYGLVWNGLASSAVMPVVFSSGTKGATCISGMNNAIFNNWPNATNNTADPNYELAGPQVFRMEYCYVLKGQAVAGTAYPSIVSDTPWDTRNPGPNHTSVNGLQDVAAIRVVIAVIDAKTRVLVSNSQLTQLAGQMNDFSSTASPNPGDLEAQWQTVLNTTAVIPRTAASSIHVYGRTFYLSSASPTIP